jgi:hypothetical protein
MKLAIIGPAIGGLEGTLGTGMFGFSGPRVLQGIKTSSGAICRF